MMEFDLYVFDWSGVCSDDRLPVYDANMHLLRRFSKPIMTFEEWLPRTTVSPIEFLADHGVTGERDVLFALYKHYFDEAIKNGIRPFAYDDLVDGIASVVDHDKRAVVLSAHPVENLMNEAKEYGVFDLIDDFVGGAKNKADGLKEIIRRRGIRSDRVIYTGDTIYDIEAAKKAGIVSAAMSGPVGQQR